MGRKKMVYFHFIAIFLNRIKLLTFVRKHNESHATFLLVFMEVDLYLIPFKRPISSQTFIVYTGILYETLCVFLSTIFVLFACTWKYSTLLSRTVCCILSTYCTYVYSYLQASTIGSSVALPMSALSHWMNCGSALAMVASNN